MLCGPCAGTAWVALLVLEPALVLPAHGTSMESRHLRVLWQLGLEPLGIVFLLDSQEFCRARWSAPLLSGGGHVSAERQPPCGQRADTDPVFVGPSQGYHMTPSRVPSGLFASCLPSDAGHFGQALPVMGRWQSPGLC